MAQRLPDAYIIDPADPRAPTQAEWDRMSPAQRAGVVSALPVVARRLDAEARVAELTHQLNEVRAEIELLKRRG